MIETIILVAVVAIIALWFGMFLGAKIGWNARENAAKKFVQEYMNNVYNETKANTVTIEVSREGDMFLVHNKETGEFLAQGVDHLEISKTLGDRFPTKTFVAVPENLEKVGYKLNDAI